MSANSLALRRSSPPNRNSIDLAAGPSDRAPPSHKPMVQTLKQYVLSLGPPSNETLRYVVTTLVICWAWSMLFGRKPWSASGKVRPSALPDLPPSLTLAAVPLLRVLDRSPAALHRDW